MEYLNKLLLFTQNTILEYKTNLKHREAFKESLSVIYNIRRYTFKTLKYMDTDYQQTNITYNNNNKFTVIAFTMCAICGEYDLSPYKCACYENYEHFHYNTREITHKNRKYKYINYDDVYEIPDTYCGGSEYI